MIGWIEYEDIPDFLNTLKLIIVASHNEGGPMTLVEAMGCGTPALATSVGFVPDMIRDEQTGFMLEDSTPECIARNVIRAIGHADLNEISKQARDLIQEEYSFDAVVAYCHDALLKLRSK